MENVLKLKIGVAAAVAMLAGGAQAALTTYAPWETAYTANGLSGVLFNVGTGSGGVTAAVGAHAYKNGVSLPNDGVSQYQAAAGTYPGEPNRANWSFDFGWQYGNCSTCSAWLGIDTDFGAAVSLTWVQVGNAAGAVPGVVNPESWNMLMSFLAPLGFDANAPSHTTFALEVRDGQSRTSNLLADSSITVNVPEPASLALVALALAAAGVSRRRKA